MAVLSIQAPITTLTPSNESSDPLRVLPSEIWEVCLLEACLGDAYMAALLDLTTVSAYWMRKILKSPLLWSRIDLDDAHQDLLATLTLFLLLSGKSQLSIRVSAPLGNQMNPALRLLCSHRHRIRQIVLRRARRNITLGRTSVLDVDFGTSLQYIVKNIGPLPSLRSVDVVSDRPVPVPSTWMGLSSRKYSENWILSFRLLKSCPKDLIGRRKLTIHVNDLASIAPLLHIAQLNSLSVYSDETDYVQSSSTPEAKPIDIAIPVLKTLRYQGRIDWASSQLLGAVSQSLQNLVLQVSIHELSLAERALTHAHSLRTFKLTVLALEPTLRAMNRPSVHLPTTIENWRTRIAHGLDNEQVDNFHCEIQSIDGRDIDSQTLWTCFHVIFPQISSLMGSRSLETGSLRLLVFSQAEFESYAADNSLRIVTEKTWGATHPQSLGLISETRVAEAIITGSIRSTCQASSWMNSSICDTLPPKYMISAIPNNPDGQLRFHWGQPIPILWKAPLTHSRRDWMGIYKDGANLSPVTHIDSLGLWVPVHEEEWDGDTARPPRDHDESEMTETGELVFKGFTLPWQVGEYELRYHLDEKFQMVSEIRHIEIFLDPPEGLTFAEIHEWLQRIVCLALDSDPALMPRSALAPSDKFTRKMSHSTMSSLSDSAASPDASLPFSDEPESLFINSPTEGASFDNDSNTFSSASRHFLDDDFQFWSDAFGRKTMSQARRIAYAVQEALRVSLELQDIMENPNITSLTRRVLRLLWRQQRASSMPDSEDAMARTNKVPLTRNALGTRSRKRNSSRFVYR